MIMKKLVGIYNDKLVKDLKNTLGKLDPSVRVRKYH